MRLINADALIADINECIDVQNDNWEFERTIGLTIALECISDAPTIEPERKKGRWSIKNGELTFWDVCSECGGMVIHKAPFYDFCPKCGADMR